jgi:hypothetical protein
VDSLGTGGGATGASTIASVDAAGTTGGTSSPSPTMGCEGGLTGAVEEEAMSAVNSQQEKKRNFSSVMGKKREHGG